MEHDLWPTLDYVILRVDSDRKLDDFRCIQFSKLNVINEEQRPGRGTVSFNSKMFFGGRLRCAEPDVAAVLRGLSIDPPGFIELLINASERCGNLSRLIDEQCRNSPRIFQS